MKLVFICHRHQRSSLFLVGTVQGKCQRDLQLFFSKSPDVRYNSTGRRRDISLADIEPVLITDHVNEFQKIVIIIQRFSGSHDHNIRNSLASDLLDLVNLS